MYLEKDKAEIVNQWPLKHQKHQMNQVNTSTVKDCNKNSLISHCINVKAHRWRQQQQWWWW